ncbi:MAG: hypothetical protein BGO05_12095 [Rhizobiales bacterium 63-7]|nr:hypothetical protein [Hyphomicrobiales bacterium]OJU67313.1 MAG: hypothetical protein BGO05_12095 [Rhizobiales bacterium 63-7]
MGDVDQGIALYLFAIIGGAMGSRIVRADYWRGALATAIALAVTAAVFTSAGSNNQLLAKIGVFVAMVVACGAFRLRGIQMASTILGAYAGAVAVLAYFFWTSQ